MYGRLCGFYCINQIQKRTSGGGGQKSRKFCGHRIWKLPKRTWREYRLRVERVEHLRVALVERGERLTQRGNVAAAVLRCGGGGRGGDGVGEERRGERGGDVAGGPAAVGAARAAGELVVVGVEKSENKVGPWKNLRI